MRSAYRLAVYFLVFGLLLESSVFGRGIATESESAAVAFGSRRIAGFTPVYSDEIELTLYEAVTRRLGRPYRSHGTDDRGYDCSGLIWRVFHDAGIEFERGPALRLWTTLPDATRRERLQFGTLVFFEGLNHVGIVRDAYSFYHASSSRGVVRSYFADYWGDRIVGYRRAFAPAGAGPNAWPTWKDAAWKRRRVRQRR
ncbi:MAG: C40 family peptidase [Blastocatellia bacterium]